MVGALSIFFESRPVCNTVDCITDVRGSIIEMNINVNNQHFMQRIKYLIIT